MSLNFETVSLGEHLYIKGRIGWKGLKKDEYLNQGDYRIINATALEEEGINWDDCGYISKERFEESPEIILKDKDILISKDGTIGKLGYVKNLDMDSTVASGIFVVRNQNEEYIDTDFLYYYFKSPFFKWFIKSVTEGSVIPHLYQRDFTDMEFNLFELDAQKKCSSILNAIEEKINVNRKINKNLQELAKSIYRYHFIDFEPYSQCNFISTTLGEIPENWSVQLIEEFVDDMKNGGTPKRGEPDYWDNGTIPWLKTGEINNNIIIKSEEHITELGLKNSSAKLLPINSIIMALYGKGTAARIGLLKHEATTNQACCAMICNDFNKTLFLYLFLLFNQKEIENLASGSVQQNLSKDLIANLELVVPPIEIIEKLPFKEIYDKISNNYFEIEYLTNLRDTLLPKLMSGELDVSEINCDLE